MQDRDPRKAFDWMGFNTLGALFKLKNAVVCGHILVAVALMLNMISFFLCGGDKVNQYGIMAAVIAWLMAWFHEGEQMDPIPSAIYRIGSAVMVPVSYTMWIIGG